MSSGMDARGRAEAPKNGGAKVRRVKGSEGPQKSC